MGTISPSCTSVTGCPRRLVVSNSVVLFGSLNSGVLGGCVIYWHDSIDFFMHVFPEDLGDEIVLKSNLYAVWRGKKHQTFTNGELKHVIAQIPKIKNALVIRGSVLWFCALGALPNTIQDHLFILNMFKIYEHNVKDQTKTCVYNLCWYELFSLHNIFHQLFQCVLSTQVDMSPTPWKLHVWPKKWRWFFFYA